MRQNESRPPGILFPVLESAPAFKSAVIVATSWAVMAESKTGSFSRAILGGVIAFLMWSDRLVCKNTTVQRNPWERPFHAQSCRVCCNIQQARYH